MTDFPSVANHFIIVIMYYFIMMFVECLLNASLYYEIYILFFFFHLNCVINPGQRDITAFYRDEEAAISRQNNDNP